MDLLSAARRRVAHSDTAAIRKAYHMLGGVRPLLETFAACIRSVQIRRVARDAAKRSLVWSVAAFLAPFPNRGMYAFFRRGVG